MNFDSKWTHTHTHTRVLTRQTPGSTWRLGFFFSFCNRWTTVSSHTHIYWQAAARQQAKLALVGRVCVYHPALCPCCGFLSALLDCRVKFHQIPTSKVKLRRGEGVCHVKHLADHRTGAPCYSPRRRRHRRAPWGMLLFAQRHSGLLAVPSEIKRQSEERPQ